MKEAMRKHGVSGPAAPQLTMRPQGVEFFDGYPKKENGLPIQFQHAATMRALLPSEHDIACDFLPKVVA